jgi:multiple sugar transport system substrate-binding protein
MSGKLNRVFSVLGIFCFVALLTGAISWFFSAEKKSPLSVTVEEKDLTKASQTSVITICALRDHSFEVALNLIKESDFEEENSIRIKSILLEFKPMTKAHELNFSTKKSDFDIVSIDQPSLGRYVSNGWVRSLDEFMNNPSFPSLDVDDLIPVLRKACSEWHSKLYAIPLGSYGALLAYRTDILNSAGFIPPTTFSDFISYARKVNNPPDLYGTALFAHIGEYITADSAPFLWSWGAGLINGSDVNLPGKPFYRVAWDTPEGIAALEFYASLYREGLTPPDTLKFDHERYIGAFQSGKIAMGIMPAEGIGAPMEDTAVSKVAGKIRYTTLPGHKLADGSVSPPRTGLGAHSLAISTYSTNPAKAYLVLQYLTGIQIGDEYIRRGGRPFRNSHFTLEALDKFPYMEAMRDGMKTGRFRPNIPEYPAVSKIFFTAFHSALQHNADIAAVMRAAARKANEEILAPAYPQKALAAPGGGVND